MRYFLILILVFNSCKEKKELRVQNLEKQNTEYAVFIVKENKTNIITSIFEDLTPNNLNNKNHYFTDKENDTIRLNVGKGKQLYFCTKYNYRDTVFVANGDTIFIDLKNEKNEISSNKNLFDIKKYKKTNKINELKLNYIEVSKDYPLEIEPSEYEKRKPLYPVKVDFNKIKTDVNGVNNLIEVIKNDLINGYRYYDSIAEKKPLKRNYIEQLKENLKIDCFSEAITIYNFSLNDEAKKFLISNRFINEGLFEDNYSYQIIYRLINSILLENKKKSLGHKIIIDYKKAMSLLPNYFKGDNLAFSQIVCIKAAIDEGHSKESINELINNYKKNKINTNYDLYISKIEKDYFLKKNDKNSSEVELSDPMKLKVNLDKLLIENRNKVIYIDFWASWCAPCRKAMPASKKIKEQYKSKEVVFLYISIDNSFEAWQKAMNKEGVSENSFLAINYPEANFYKEKVLKTIPRYLIYNKKGELVNSNAPGPDSDEIIKELNKYLED